MPVMEQSARFWQRIVEIVGNDDPTDVAYMLGVSYATATRYKTGAGGSAGPAAANLEAMVASLKERKGVNLTIGQLWGTEPLAVPVDSTSVVAEGVEGSARAFAQRARTSQQRPAANHGKGRKDT